MTVLLRKASPGSDSFGHEWRTPRSVVPVSDEQAAELLAITDAGFTVVQVAEEEEPPPLPAPEETGGDGPAPAVDPDPAPAPGDDENPVLEIDPERDDASPAPRKAARPRVSRRHAE